MEVVLMLKDGISYLEATNWNAFITFGWVSSFMFAPVSAANAYCSARVYSFRT